MYFQIIIDVISLQLPSNNYPVFHYDYQQQNLYRENIMCKYTTKSFSFTITNLFSKYIYIYDTI